MNKQLKEHMIDLIVKYGVKCIPAACHTCSNTQLTTCYLAACKISNRIFANSIGFTGYDNKDDFQDNK